MPDLKAYNHFCIFDDPRHPFPVIQGTHQDVPTRTALSSFTLDGAQRVMQRYLLEEAKSTIAATRDRARAALTKFESLYVVHRTPAEVLNNITPGVRQALERYRATGDALHYVTDDLYLDVGANGARGSIQWVVTPHDGVVLSFLPSDEARVLQLLAEAGFEGTLSCSAQMGNAVTVSVPVEQLPLPVAKIWFNSRSP